MLARRCYDLPAAPRELSLRRKDPKWCLLLERVSTDSEASSHDPARAHQALCPAMPPSPLHSAPPAPPASRARQLRGTARSLRQTPLPRTRPSRRRTFTHGRSSHRRWGKANITNAGSMSCPSDNEQAIRGAQRPLCAPPPRYEGVCHERRVACVWFGVTPSDALPRAPISHRRAWRAGWCMRTCGARWPRRACTSTAQRLPTC